MGEIEIGKVIDYYAKIGVVAIDLTDSLKVGDMIHFKGRTTDFEQKVESIQIEHANVQEAKAGQSVGLKIKDRIREHDKVYKVVEE